MTIIVTDERAAAIVQMYEERGKLVRRDIAGTYRESAKTKRPRR